MSKGKVFDVFPRLRDVRIQPLTYQGRRGVLLQDPLRLTDQTLFVPAELAGALMFMDGRHTLEAIRSALAVRFGLQVPMDALKSLVQALDRALMLDNGRFRNVYREALRHFREAPARPMTHAGSVYPADLPALQDALEGYGKRVSSWPEAPAARVVGVVSPHIDYQRGGAVYAATWLPLARALQGVEQVVVLGTDHNGPSGSMTLTRQHYATPYGVLPTNRQAVDTLAAVWGEEAAFEHELHHLGEHSIELALVWLHHVLGGRSVEVVPVLVGGINHYIETGQVPWQDARLEAFIEAIRDLMEAKPTLVVAGVDLAHVGPAFGDPAPWGLAERARLKREDQRLMDAIRQGDPYAFYHTVAEVKDRFRICGFAPLYLYLRLLEGRPATITGYELCPADPEFGSIVSICGAWTHGAPMGVEVN